MKSLQEYQNLINLPEKNIWRYKELYPFVPTHRISIGEGQTALEKLGGAFVKREDKNPTGSLKDRGIAFQVSEALDRGDGGLVISSSGNAAISAVRYSREVGIKLTVFISPRTTPGKMKVLTDSNVEMKISDLPLKDSLFFAQQKGFGHLRQSVDDSAAIGYMSLGLELVEQMWEERNELSIFVPVSSATCLVGIGRAFNKLLDLEFLTRLPQLHAVQTTFINPIASEFVDMDLLKSNSRGLGLASALCAPKTQRKEEAVSLIKQSKGSGWIVSEKEIQDSLDRLKDGGVNTSAEGAAALGALYQAKKSGRDVGIPICLLTGKEYL